MIPIFKMKLDIYWPIQYNTGNTTNPSNFLLNIIPPFLLQLPSDIFNLLHLPLSIPVIRVHLFLPLKQPLL